MTSVIKYVAIKYVKNLGFWVMRSHQIIGRQQGELPNLVEFGAAPDLQSTPRGMGQAVVGR